MNERRGKDRRSGRPQRHGTPRPDGAAHGKPSTGRTDHTPAANAAPERAKSGPAKSGPAKSGPAKPGPAKPGPAKPRHARPAHPDAPKPGKPKADNVKAATATANATDSGLSVRVSRVLHVSASAIFRAVTDSERRGWAPQQLYRVVSVLAPRFIRLAFPDGSLVGIAVTRQGNARCTISVEHTRLPAGSSERAVREQWGAALAALAEQLDLEWD